MPIAVKDAYIPRPPARSVNLNWSVARPSTHRLPSEPGSVRPAVRPKPGRSSKVPIMPLSAPAPPLPSAGFPSPAVGSEVPTSLPVVAPSPAPSCGKGGGDLLCSPSLPVGEILMPSWFPPFPVREGARLHLSLVAQMDGLLYALLGVRIEHDVFAASLSDSFCSNWGTFPGASWASSVCLLYPSDFSKMDLIVATAMSHQACGLFVFPSLCSAGRLIVPAPKY